MRILFANDGVGDAGGVQNYLTAVISALRTRGHDIALVHLDPLREGAPSPAGNGAPHYCVAVRGREDALAAAMRWRPDVCFSHNMRSLDVERQLVVRLPVVKMMHGYFGTCVSGHKMHAFPRAVVCHRRFGMACAALYFPRHCGQWSLAQFSRQYSWTREQHALLGQYAAVMVASRHMGDEYAGHGVRVERLVVNPLFSDVLPPQAAEAPRAFRVLFLGRMTSLKGGDVLIRAVARASAAGAQIALTMAGDGPSRDAWEHLSAAAGVNAAFPGWVNADARAALYRDASVVAVPSVWPEPFGLIGLEAGAYGVPSLAFDVGGIREWLRPGVNGWLVPPRGEERALGDALAQIHGAPSQLAAMRVGARRVAEELSLERHVSALETLLERVASSASAA